MTNYAKVDHTNRRIVMDRTFAKNAEIVGSTEYNQLQACRKDYPTYTVVRREIKKNPNQVRYSGLTYQYITPEVLFTASSGEAPCKTFSIISFASSFCLIIWAAFLLLPHIYNPTQNRIKPIIPITTAIVPPLNAKQAIIKRTIDEINIQPPILLRVTSSLSFSVKLP